MATESDHLAFHLYDALNGRGFGPTTNANKVNPKFRAALAAAIRKFGDLNEGKPEKERWDEVRRVRAMIQQEDTMWSEESEEEVIEKSKEQTSGGSKKRTTKTTFNQRYNNKELAWLWQWFQDNATSGPGWFFAGSIAFKTQWNRPDPQAADYGVRNIYQAMKSCGHFDPGMICDEAFYAVEANVPRKSRAVQTKKK
ncbi:hypothetical protein E2P81_ATG00758 [Venturia nashicola]|nr:hypothetical protein E2P81_ATG00758 [Venturia nashicola]